VTKWISLGFAIIAFVAGLRAALLWYRASKVEIVPMWVDDGRMEPLDMGLSNLEWIVAILKSQNKAGDLNRVAAIWTAISIGFRSIATLVGAF
jgi:hypothetical protein